MGRDGEYDALVEAEAAYLDAMEEAAKVATPEQFAQLLTEHREIDARAEAQARAFDTMGRVAAELEGLKQDREQQ